ncbi:hypothetical protein WN943_006008 [Citrus x changshan-huyou]
MAAAANTTIPAASWPPPSPFPFTFTARSDWGFGFCPCKCFPEAAEDDAARESLPTAKVTEILLEMDQTEILHLLESPEESGSRLLSNYFKSGKIKEAKNLFDEIPEKNAVSWSIVIHGYSIKGFHEKSMKALSHAQFFHYSWCSCCGSRLEKLGTCEIYSRTNGEIWVGI